jgi:uncharacterized delta-60 repeat protein
MNVSRFVFRCLQSLLFAGLLLLGMVSTVPPAQAAGVTVITHGYVWKPPLPHDSGWVEAMGNYIADIANRSGGTATVLKLVITYDPLLGYQRVWQLDAGGGSGANSNGEIIVKVYWDSIAADPIAYPSSDIAQVVANCLLEPSFTAGNFHADQPLTELPIHLIGHSRGGSVMTEVSRILGQGGCWVDQVTTLDPHPIDSAGNDAEAKIFETTVYADNYYEQYILTYPNGVPVIGAFNRNLTGYLPGGYVDGYDNLVIGNHSDVHLWYHGTINTDAHAWDGDPDDNGGFTDDMRANWYAKSNDRNGNADEAQGVLTGYHYSRLNGHLWDAHAEGIYNAYDFTLSNVVPSNRTAVNRNQANQWPNLIYIAKTSGNNLHPGDPFNLHYICQSYNQSAYVDFYLSPDQNPYSGHSIFLPTSGSGLVNSTQRSTPTVAVTATLPGDLNPGSYYLYGRIRTASNDKTRYAYLGEKVVVTAGSVIVAPPAIPSGLSVHSVSATELSISWNSTANATGYVLQRRLENSNTYSDVPVTGGVTAIFDYGLASGKTYYYHVKALGSASSEFSAEASATTRSADAPVLLTVNTNSASVAPSIYVGVNDSSGLADGTAPFTRQYTGAVTVMLIAPATWDGRAFVKWQRDAQDGDTTPQTAVLMNASHTMTAVYASPPAAGCNIALNPSPEGAGSVTGAGAYAINATVNINATANAGYHFVNWTINTPWTSGGQVFSATAVTSFIASGNLTLIANFAPNVVGNAIALSVSPNGTGNVTGSGNYATGQTATITATPASGYTFGTWTDEFGTLVSLNSSFTFPVYQSRNLVAHFNVAASGAPDLVPRITSYQTAGFAGASLQVSYTLTNYGTGSSSSCAGYFVITSSNTAVPDPQDFLNSSSGVWVGANSGGLPAGVQGGGSLGWTLPSTLAPGSYYLWYIVDPAHASGEPSANWTNNNVVVPLTILPPPPVDGPDLQPHDFSASSSVAIPGASLSVTGGIRNVGNASSMLCHLYVSLSTSATVAPDKNILNSVGTLSSLGIYVDAGSSSGFTLPADLAPGHYYLWVMIDPENTAGEPAGNRENNNFVLPLSVVSPLQTYTIAASVSPSVAGSISGAGAYASGAVVPLVATPGAGYPFVNWTENGTVVSTDPAYAFAATGDRTLVANFLVPTRVVTPGTGGNGTISPSTPQNVANGNGVTFTAAPSGGYRVNTWSVNGSVVQVGGRTFSLSHVTADTAVNVTFKPSSLSAAGDLDPSFGTGGKVVTAFGSSDELGQGLVVQPDGRIVVVGCCRLGTGFDTIGVARYNSDGSLDTSFNGTGQVTLTVGSGGSFNTSVALQSDGRIIVAGLLTLARLNPNGSLDTTFNGTGKVSTSPQIIYSTLVQNDGKIVVAGYATISGNNHFALARYNSNGTLDTSFNGTGKVTTVIGNGADIAHRVVQQSDGKLIVTGYTTLATASDRALATVRYDSDGSLDTSFGGTGIVTTDFGSSDDEAFGLAVQSDGRIVVAGFGDANRHIVLARYNANGLLDTTFNGTGKVLTTGNGSTGFSLALQTDGKILVTGGSANLFILLRCNTDGSMDTSFNDTGIVTTDIGSGVDIGTDVAVQSDGRILVVGQSSNGSNYDFGMVRYLGISAPDIMVEQPVLINLASGGSRSFGNVDVGASNSLTFTIRNTGGSDLTGLIINKDGSDAGLFTLTASPAVPVAPNGTTTFTVRFAPASPGTKSAALHIASNVAAKSPFDIALTGVGNTASESWRQLWFGTTQNSGNAQDLADPNHNGVPNLLEYALGGDPTGIATGLNILPQVGRSAANTLQLTLTRALDRNDLTLTVQAADSPAGPWTALARSTAGGAFQVLAPGSTVLESGAGNTRTVTVTDLFPVTDPTHPQRYLKLEVGR